MKLPKAWNSILVDQYIELREVEETPSSSFVDKDIEILSILTDKDIEHFEDLQLREVTEMLSSLKWIRKEPPKTITKQIGEFHYIGVDSLILAEYIDLTHFFQDDFVKNLTSICGILFRQKSTDKWGREEFEPYEYDPIERGQMFLELPITSVYGVISEFLEFKKNFEETHKNLFNEDMSDEPEAAEEDKEAQEEEDRLNKWSWERTAYTLADNDITKIDDVLGLKLNFVFKILAMKKDLDL